MSTDVTQTIEWDGNVVTGWVIVDGESRRVSADRDTIHAQAPGFDDALSWEIDRHSAEIFEKLLPYFRGSRPVVTRKDRSPGESSDVRQEPPTQTRDSISWEV
jgi:hypothetical protein